MTLLKLAMGTQGLGGLLRGLGLRRDGEKNAEHLLVQDEPVAQLRKDSRFGIEDDVHVETGAVFLVGHAHEVALVHFLHGFDLATTGRDLVRDAVNGFLQAFFLAGGVQHKQTFVSFHFSFPSVSEGTTTPLKSFIAWRTPASSQHSTWPPARRRTLSITSASVAVNRPSTCPVIARASARRPMPIRNRANSVVPKCCSSDSKP